MELLPRYARYVTSLPHVQSLCFFPSLSVGDVFSREILVIDRRHINPPPLALDIEAAIFYQDFHQILKIDFYLTRSHFTSSRKNGANINKMRAL